MLAKGYKVLFVIVLGVIVIITIILFAVYSGKEKTEEEIEKPAGVFETEEVEKKQITFTAPKMTDTEKTQAELQNLSLIFTERFGTYSFYNNSSNFAELKNFSTDSFYYWLSNGYEKSLKSEYNENSVYKSVVTEAMAVEFVELNDAVAKIEVATKRTKKQNNNGETLELTQKLELELIKSNGAWLVNHAYWLK